MKKIYFILLSVVTFLFANCNTNEPSTPGGGSSSSSETPKANFSCEIQQPLTINIKDRSIGSRVVYDFGNGKSTTISPGESISNKYSNPGDYIIKAIAYNSNGEKAELHKSISIAEPRVIVSAIEFKAVEVDDRYYKMVLEDSGLLVKKNWVEGWSADILYDAILPVGYNINEELSNISKHTYYTLYIYYSKQQSGGTKCLEKKINVSEIKKYPEYIDANNSSGKTSVRMYFRYK